ncbi:hypothetical protein EDD86DRAFT_272853 [Gorgonomyces haynaldii]|nr:hypothetical protein EDD86DRAFT_272853 [Gorgonomyces haynaldii]
MSNQSTPNQVFWPSAMQPTKYTSDSQQSKSTNSRTNTRGFDDSVPSYKIARLQAPPIELLAVGHSQKPSPVEEKKMIQKIPKRVVEKRVKLLPPLPPPVKHERKASNQPRTLVQIQTAKPLYEKQHKPRVPHFTPEKRPKPVSKPIERHRALSITKPRSNPRKPQQLMKALKKTEASTEKISLLKTPKPKKATVESESESETEDEEDDDFDDLELDTRQTTAEDEEKPGTGDTQSTNETIKEPSKPKLQFLSQLSPSELNLLSKTTGPFRGPTDSYALFLTLGKKTTTLGRRVLATKLKQTDLGLLDEIIVEKNPNRTTILRNQKTMERLRRKHKEHLRKEVARKSHVLEELRIMIITNMKALSAYAKTLSQLMADNKTIKEHYERQTNELNAIVSSILQENENSDSRIKQLAMEKIHLREQLTRQLAAFLREQEQSLQETKHLLKSKQDLFKAKEEDLEDLRHFKSVSQMDPEIKRKQIQAQEEAHQQLLADQQLEIQNFGLFFEQEKQNADQLVLDKVMDIIEVAKTRLSKVLKNRTIHAHQESVRIRKEIQIQQEYQKDLLMQVQEVESNNLILSTNKLSLIDERRVPVKDRMTCKPEMDVVC